MKALFPTPLGPILLQATPLGLQSARLIQSAAPLPVLPDDAARSPILRQATAWLSAYFSHAPLPPQPNLLPQGTAYSRRVWAVLRTVPYGQTLSYGQLARLLQPASSPRAVGQAVGRNPLFLFIPCHRVTAAHTLGGFAYGIEAKRWLLQWEGGGGGYARPIIGSSQNPGA